MTFDSGTLPTGLTYTPSTGVLAGTATTDGTYVFTIAATNGYWNAQRQFSLTVGGCPSNYALLLHFNSDSSSAPIDASTNALTGVYYGDATLASQSPSHFPEQSSAYFDGATDGINVTYPSSLELDGVFTIDFWFRIDDITRSQALMSPQSFSGSPTNHYFEIHWVSSSNGYVTVLSNNAAGNSFTGTTSTYNTAGTVVNDIWYHFALTRDESDNCQAYLNGVAGDGNTGPQENREQIINWGGYLKIGDGGYGDFGGYIDEFRIVKGERMWTADFSSTFSSNPPEPEDC
jgi:hypothetical protein